METTQTTDNKEFQKPFLKRVADLEKKLNEVQEKNAFLENKINLIIKSLKR